MNRLYREWRRLSCFRMIVWRRDGIGGRVSLKTAWQAATSSGSWNEAARPLSAATMNMNRGRAAAARQAHNLEVVGATPTPGTNLQGAFPGSPEIRVVAGLSGGV